MTANESVSRPLAHDAAQSHLTLMSVMFGVALGFWVSTVHAHDLKDWSLPLGISVFLTLAVIICVYWWYIHLCSLFPSHTLVNYSIDFMIVIGLCSMSKSCVDKTQFMWTLAWSFLAAVASLKVWFCFGKITKPFEPLLLWPPRIAAPVILFFGLYSATLAHEHESPSYLVTILTGVPVVVGIIVTFVIARIYPRKATSSQNESRM